MGIIISKIKKIFKQETCPHAFMRISNVEYRYQCIYCKYVLEPIIKSSFDQTYE